MLAPQKNEFYSDVKNAAGFAHSTATPLVLDARLNSLKIIASKNHRKLQVTVIFYLTLIIVSTAVLYSFRLPESLIFTMLLIK
ncbi:MAG: hypothetical protein IKZ88_02685 [Neisseriaceae bacterium]|nr:hypothetical protein [Neisseriaceae bacterium]